MGKIRRFSPAFLREERQKLADYRDRMRLCRDGKGALRRAENVPAKINFGDKIYGTRTFVEILTDFSQRTMQIKCSEEPSKAS